MAGCALCPLGKWNDASVDGSACYLCPDGTVGNASDVARSSCETQCLRCPDGDFAGTFEKCSRCPAGRATVIESYSAKSGARCGAYIGARRRAGPRTDRRRGTPTYYNGVEDIQRLPDQLSTCRQCAAAEAPVADQSVCAECAAGRYASRYTWSSNSCAACPPGKWTSPSCRRRTPYSSFGIVNRRRAPM